MQGRLRGALRRRGWRGLIAEAIGRTRGRFDLHERHLWYVLDLERVRPQPLAPGYELLLVGDEEIELLERLDATPPDLARRFVERGNQLWLAHRDRDPGFVCFIFREEVPAVAAEDGRLQLADDLACLEYSYASPDHRGNNLAVSTWTEVAQRLRSEGYAVLVTKVEVDNAPARRAVEKAGFLGTTIMDFRRRLASRRVRFEPLPVEPSPAERRASEEIERRLAR